MHARRRQLSVVPISELTSPFIVLEFLVNSKTAEQKLSKKKIKRLEERCLENMSLGVVLCVPSNKDKSVTSIACFV